MQQLGGLLQGRVGRLVLMMMMKLGGELYAARLRLDGLAAKSQRITCRPR